MDDCTTNLVSSGICQNGIKSCAVQHIFHNSLKDHEVRELVNDLRDCAIKFHNHQSLRERIANILIPKLIYDDKNVL